MAVSAQPGDVWESGAAYERYVGRWSRAVAPEFLDWLPAGPGAAWCDIGCGAGALAGAVLASQRPGRVLGIDPSIGFLAAARRIDDRRFDVVGGTADALPLADGLFDRVVSALVLNFVADRDGALREMRRVTAFGGRMGAYVWDYADGMQMIRAFWDAAVELDPGAADLDEAHRFPLCRPEPLEHLFSTAGLDEVTVRSIEVATVFADFEDLWRPFLGGQGPAPGYCVSLSESRRSALREELRSRLPPDPDGAIRLIARAWAVQGRVA